MNKGTCFAACGIIYLALALGACGQDTKNPIVDQVVEDPNQTTEPVVDKTEPVESKLVSYDLSVFYVAHQGHGFILSSSETVYCGPVDQVRMISTNECEPAGLDVSLEVPDYETKKKHIEHLFETATIQFVAISMPNALVLAPIDPNVDCAGPVGPYLSTWCGDINKMVGGVEVPYDDKWFVGAFFNSQGECLLLPIKDECGKTQEGHDQVCQLDTTAASAKDFAQCVAEYQCTDNAGCDDGNLCTTDTCCIGDGCGQNYGYCIFTDTSVIDCDDHEPCTTDSCDPSIGCGHFALADGAQVECNDGVNCTTDVCSAGVCTSTDKVCNDSNQCTADSCDETDGNCVFAPLTGDSCDDALLCTTGDTCAMNDNGTAGDVTDDFAECVGTPVVCDDDNPCTTDVCDDDDGQCDYSPVVAGTLATENDVECVCDTDMYCDPVYCEFTSEELAAGTTTLYQCLDDQDDSLTKYQKCDRLDGTAYGVWETLDVCGPFQPIQLAHCNIGNGGCDLYASGYGACVTSADCVNPMHECIAGHCVEQCTADCAGKECGSDGCGGSCGTCGGGESCDASGTCVPGCVPSCTGKECGSDGCGGSCGSCGSGQVCDASGICQGTCTPDCAGKECGSDGCGGSCGTCSSGSVCNSSEQCVLANQLDNHGSTPYGASGANGGPDPDGTPDSQDDDGDGYCEIAPCTGSANPGLKVADLLGGDCDDNPTGSAQFPIDTGGGSFMTDGSYNNHPGAPEWCESVLPGFDNDCNGTPNDGC